MPANSAKADAGARQEQLRAVIEREYDRLCAGIAALICRPGERLEPDELKQQVEEALGETVQRALAGAGSFDPSRPAVPWLMGIAAHVLQGQRREWVRTRRVLPQSDVGKSAWDLVLERLSGSATAAVPDATQSDRLDVENALAQLEAEAREVIVLRFYQGLDGQELAQALNAPSAGAARVRLCRALQALRGRFAPASRLAAPSRADQDITKNIAQDMR